MQAGTVSASATYEVNDNNDNGDDNYNDNGNDNDDYYSHNSNISINYFNYNEVSNYYDSNSNYNNNDKTVQCKYTLQII